MVKGGERIAKKSKGMRNAPSKKTGKKSGPGRAVRPPSKKK
jgi:hypothetical protein